MRFVLVHSPVLGPTAWRWVAEALRSDGHDVVVPDLLRAARSGTPSVFARAAIDQSRSDERSVIVGHSGAGAVLPLIAAGQKTPPRALVFIDAGLPPCRGAFTVGGAFTGVLRTLAVDGVLPKWSRWWEPGAMETLVSDPQRRRDVETELPQVPLTFFQMTIEAPGGWCTIGAAYVLLSEAYQRDADRAATRGWPVFERPGTHLDLVNDERRIADTLLEASAEL